MGQGDDGSWKWCFQRLFYAYAGLPCIIDNGTTKTTKTFRTTAGGRYYIDLDTIISTLFYKNISRTSAVSSTNFGSILIFVLSRHYCLDTIVWTLLSGYYCLDTIVWTLLSGHYCLDTIVWTLLSPHRDELPWIPWLSDIDLHSIAPVERGFLLILTLYNFLPQRHVLEMSSIRHSASFRKEIGTFKVLVVCLHDLLSPISQGEQSLRHFATSRTYQFLN